MPSPLPPRQTVVALTPSRGLGGGIERYAEGVLDALRSTGVEVCELQLLASTRPDPKLSAKLMFAVKAIPLVLGFRSRRPSTLLVFHPSLSSLAVLARLIRARGTPTTKVFLYGTDAWSLRASERWAIRRCRADLITISSFSAGSLVRTGNANVLAPGLSKEWYDLLTQEPSPTETAGTGARILSVFRLEGAEAKGAFTLLAAVDILRVQRPEVAVTLAGSGPAPSRLRQEVAQRKTWVRLVENPGSEDLAALYRTADLFVLATRTDARRGCGEGFGIVLIEAMIAGAPVIAPAYGGSADAALGGLTAVRPAGESHRDLADAIDWVLGHPEEAETMSRNGMTWARTAFEPTRFAALARSVIFGTGPVPPVPLRLEAAADQGPGNGDAVSEFQPIED